MWPKVALVPSTTVAPPAADADEDQAAADRASPRTTATPATDPAGSGDFLFRVRDRSVAIDPDYGSAARNLHLRGRPADTAPMHDVRGRSRSSGRLFARHAAISV